METWGVAVVGIIVFLRTLSKHKINSPLFVSGGSWYSWYTDRYVDNNCILALPAIRPYVTQRRDTSELVTQKCWGPESLRPH